MFAFLFYKYTLLDQFTPSSPLVLYEHNLQRL